MMIYGPVQLTMIWTDVPEEHSQCLAPAPTLVRNAAKPHGVQRVLPALRNFCYSIRIVVPWLRAYDDASNTTVALATPKSTQYM